MIFLDQGIASSMARSVAPKVLSEGLDILLLAKSHMVHRRCQQQCNTRTFKFKLFSVDDKGCRNTNKTAGVINASMTIRLDLSWYPERTIVQTDGPPMLEAVAFVYNWRRDCRDSKQRRAEHASCFINPVAQRGFDGERPEG